MNIAPKMKSEENRRLTEYTRAPWSELEKQPGPARGWFMIRRERYLRTIMSFGESQLRQLLGK